MRQTTKYIILNLILLIIYIGFIIFGGIFGFIKYWFGAVLLLYGVSLFYRSKITKSMSNLWFALSLFLIGVGWIYFTFLNYIVPLWFVVIIAFGVSSFMVFIIYKDYLHLCLAISNFSIIFPIILFIYNILTKYVYILVQIISVIVGFSYILFISNKNKLKNKNSRYIF